MYSLRCISKKSRVLRIINKYYDVVGYVLSRQKQFQLLATDSNTTPEVTHVGGGAGLDVEGKI